jgi:hypothetical protein
MTKLEREAIRAYCLAAPSQAMIVLTPKQMLQLLDELEALPVREPVTSFASPGSMAANSDGL